MPSGPGTYGSKRGRPAKKQMTKKSNTKKVMIKGADLSSLTKRQQETMKKHSVHHTGKHMKIMATMMKRGDSFTKAHKAAQKKVGK
tara:strand:+ start:958 stop:1215 length:258 start_codon:yes stop_codon:yes gene_type:complete